MFGDGFRWAVCRAKSTLLRGQRAQLLWPRNQRCAYLHLGCETRIHEDFVNLDYWAWPGVDLCWDITRGLPFPDRRFAGIFTEHCLEHVSYTEAAHVLGECRRILKPGGVVRLIVPDAELYLRAYDRGKREAGVTFPYGQPADTRSADGQTPLMHLYALFRDHGHKAAYDFLTLECLLKDQGFQAIRREHYMSGRQQALLLDFDWRVCESLYVEAQAP